MSGLFRAWRAHLRRSSTEALRRPPPTSESHSGRSRRTTSRRWRGPPSWPTEAKDGTKRPLRAYATMNTETIGRTASSRGVTDAVGTGGKVAIDIGECDLCNSLFSEEAIIGGDPVPPGHPGCTCSVIGPA